MRSSFLLTKKAILSGLILSGIVLAQVPREGLVAWYPFTGNANDSSGAGQHGIATKVEKAPDRFGNENCAYQFIGTDSSKIVANGSPNLPEGNNPKSLILWFRNAGYALPFALMAGFGEAHVHNRSFQLGYRYDTLCVNGYGGQYDWETDVLYSPYNDGNWHHYVGTYDGTETIIYLDGIKKASNTIRRFLTGTNRIVIGNETDGATWPFRGFLDDVAIYDRVLAHEEITSIYTCNNYSITLHDITNTNNIRPVFSWHTNADVSDYVMYVDTTNIFTNPLIADSVSDTAYQPTIDLPVGTIYWKVSAHIGLISEVGSFLMLDPLVPITIPFAPCYIYNKKPTFKWYKVKNATGYTIEVSRDISFTDMVTSTPVSDTVYSPAENLPVDTLFWRVKSDLSTTCSNVEKIIILSDSIPELYRFDGIKVDTYKPTFKWKPVTGAVSYHIKIDSVSTFPLPILFAPVSDTIFQLPTDIIEKELFWQVSSNLMPDVFSPYDSLTTLDSTNIFTKPVLYKNKSVIIQPVSNSLIKIAVHSNKLNGDAILSIYNITGRQIKKIKTAFTDSKQFVLWNCTNNNGRKVPAGVYVIQVKTEALNAVGKVHLAY